MLKCRLLYTPDERCVFSLTIPLGDRVEFDSSSSNSSSDIRRSRWRMEPSKSSLENPGCNSVFLSAPFPLTALDTPGGASGTGSQTSGTLLFRTAGKVNCLFRNYLVLYRDIKY